MLLGYHIFKQTLVNVNSPRAKRWKLKQLSRVGRKILVFALQIWKRLTLSFLNFRRSILLKFSTLYFLVFVFEKSLNFASYEGQTDFIEYGGMQCLFFGVQPQTFWKCLGLGKIWESTQPQNVSKYLKKYENVVRND